MAYITQALLEDRLGLSEVVLYADRDGDGLADADVVARAIDDASAEMDGYLAGRYSLPISGTVPPLLVRIAADLALYRLALAHQVTEELRRRYDDAVRLLRGIQSGAISLGLPASETPPPSGPTAEAFGPLKRDREGLW